MRARTSFPVALLVALAGCASERGERTPSGSPTDPVETCERVGDVCRLDDSRLGVCVSAGGPSCEGDACYECAPQH